MGDRIPGVRVVVTKTLKSVIWRYGREAESKHFLRLLFLVTFAPFSFLCIVTHCNIEQNILMVNSDRLCTQPVTFRTERTCRIVANKYPHGKYRLALICVMQMDIAIFSIMRSNEKTFNPNSSWFRFEEKNIDSSLKTFGHELEQYLLGVFYGWREMAFLHMKLRW